MKTSSITVFYLLLVLIFCAFGAEGQNSTIWFTVLEKNDTFCSVLTASDVEVRDGKTKFRIESVTLKANVPLEVVILIDTSASQTDWIGSEINTAAYFINNILQKNKDKVAIVKFSGNTTLVHDLTDDLEGAKASLLGIEIDLPADKSVKGDPLPQPVTPVVNDSGKILEGINSYDVPKRDKTSKIRGTFVWKSAKRAVDVFGGLKPTGARRAILLITDGKDTFGNLDFDEAVDSSLGNQIPIYPIGINDPNSVFTIEADLRLTEIADRSGGLVLLPQRKNVPLELRRPTRETYVDINPLGPRLRNYYEVVISREPAAEKDKIRKLDIRIINDSLCKAKVKVILPRGFRLN